jgi:monofunctional biosynthetic peptidoglycan transglycosylase
MPARGFSIDAGLPGMSRLPRIDPDPDGERRRVARERLARRSPWNPRHLLRRLALWALGALVLSIALVASCGRVDPPLSAFMLGEWGGAVLEGRRDFRLRHAWRPLRGISPAAARAVIAAEDQKFLKHHGFDFDAIGSALAERESGGRLRGASTISQQVAKNLYLWRGRQWLRKGLEAWFTLWIELLWSKQRILEVYLNVAQFGPGLYGVEAASQAYFGHGADRLAAPEAALLAAVLPNPEVLSVAAPSPYLRRRQAWIVRQMPGVAADFAP